jgi:hypothetical protein
MPPTAVEAGAPITSNSIELDKPYVTYYVIRFPPFPGYGFLNGLVFPALLKIQRKDIVVDSAGFLDPTALKTGTDSGKLPFKIPPEYEAGRGQPWAIFVQWRKISDTVSGVNQAGADVVVKLILVLAIASLGYMTFRAITTSAKELGNAAGKTIFSPGVIIAAMVIVALIVGKGRSS